MEDKSFETGTDHAMAILKLPYLRVFPLVYVYVVYVYLCFSTVQYVLYVLSAYLASACFVCPAPISLCVCLSDRLACLLVCLDSTQISDSQFLCAADCREGSINSPLGGGREECHTGPPPLDPPLNSGQRPCHGFDVCNA